MLWRIYKSSKLTIPAIQQFHKLVRPKQSEGGSANPQINKSANQQINKSAVPQTCPSETFGYYQKERGVALTSKKCRY